MLLGSVRSDTISCMHGLKANILGSFYSTSYCTKYVISQSSDASLLIMPLSLEQARAATCHQPSTTSSVCEQHCFPSTRNQVQGDAEISAFSSGWPSLISFDEDSQRPQPTPRRVIAYAHCGTEIEDPIECHTLGQTFVCASQSKLIQLLTSKVILT